MPKTLVIVESPAKAKSISKFLSKNYLVKASMGHLRDLPKSQMGVNIEHDFEPKYIPIRGRGDLIKELKSAAKTADQVLLASDPDREGEAIAWHLMHLLGISQEKSSRVEFHEITKPTIQKAIKNPRKIDMDKVDAQQARRVLDRLVGYKLSPLLWKKVKKGLSAGRVQSVAVRLIYDREEEIKAFEPQEYWTLFAQFACSNGKFSAKLIHKGGKKIEIKSRQEIDEIIKQVDQAVCVVNDVKNREKRKQPSPPFTTSSLQQEAYRKLNFAPKRTMMLAQQLYEGIDLGKAGTVGLITYMRTDSVRISEIAQDEAKEFILGSFGSDFYPGPRNYTSKGRAQEAHEAVRPTSVYRTPDSVKEFLSRDQFRLYRLIWDRFVASQMSAAVYDTLTVDVAADDYTFRANASTIRFSGYLSVYEEGTDESEEKQDSDDNCLNMNLTSGQKLKLSDMKEKQHFTEPPPRYTEASLVKKMEEEGIGRPSTYAPTIDTIQSRGYVAKEDKKLVPTELGEIVVVLLKEHFKDIVDLEFTANMEEKLDDIEEGTTPWKSVIRDFYIPFEETLNKAETAIGKIKVEDQESDVLCELCGRKMVIKMGRFGKFLACPGFPDCRNAKPLLEEVGIKCPQCGEKIVARRSKKGRKFYGCSNYPECNFVSWEKPAPENCPQCSSLMTEKIIKQKLCYVCTNKDCRHVEEKKE